MAHREELKPNVVIAVASGPTINVPTMASIVSALIHMAENSLPSNLIFQIGGYKDVNLNKLVFEARKYKATHIMFIDTDMVFPPDGILTLLKDDKDIVGGNYNTRLDPTSADFSGPTVKMLVDGQSVSMLKEDFPTELFKCHALPLGFMLVKMHVFDKVPMPYFEDHQRSSGYMHMTEDVDFCVKAHKAGFDTWCEPAVKIGHIGQYVY